MKTATWAQLRANIPRLLAAAVAIILSVGFIVGTLTLSDTFNQTVEKAFTATLAKSDVTVTPEETTPEQQPSDAAATKESAAAEKYLSALRSTEGVDTAGALYQSYAELRFGTKRTYAELTALPAERLRWQQLASGDWPRTADQLTVDKDTAMAQSVGVGDSVTLLKSEIDAESGALKETPVDLTIIGITKPEGSVINSGAATVGMTEAGLKEVFPDLTPISYGVAGAGSSDTDLATSVSYALDQAGLGSAQVQTRQEALAEKLDQVVGSTQILTTVVLVFGFIALLVAGIVIANTFQVLVAQRTRELALLRCIGADAGQVRRSVLTESLVLGLAASALGVLVGYGLASGVALWSRMANSGIQLGTAQLSVASISIGMVVGVVVTVGAALSPARRATRVRPLAALRPADEVDVKSKRGMVRLIIAFLMIVVGIVGLIAGALKVGITLALPAGALTFLGLLLASSLLIPLAVRAVGMLVSWTGVPGKLAALNAVRNPGRTAATAAALLVGVTLVGMMIVGSASVRTSVQNQIDERRPVDLWVQTTNPDGLTENQLSAAATEPDVRESVVLDGTPVSFGTEDSAADSTEASTDSPLIALGAPASDIQKVAHSGGLVPKPGQLLVNPITLNELGIANQTVKTGSSIAVTAGHDTIELTIKHENRVPDGVIMVAPGDLTRLDSTPTAQQVWLELDPDLSSSEIQSVQSNIMSHGDELSVYGGAAERAIYGEVLDMLLLVVLCLLAIAVVIALVGVGNTMALSVLERRRESALLRAMGLTKGQLRGMLAIEAVLVAAVAAVLGVIFGVFFAWAGAASILMETDITASLSIPWAQIGTVVAVAAIAGLLASVLPARRATKMTPVEGLAVD
ncbi:ABC transporter permease [Saxibacter everestensis]|uniref:ABC transporter permease n=1 Tax=Saxibacter everestensis TaxID=2909229 RepID=A0ABY8QXR2_9MICO|nr:ABC transporter permease [Brevibacteriaceae bacterium ZFBP1038]